eukprot:COSAG06_NODE_24_length_32981_cov_25.509671_22_plen_87_part_00
MHEESVTLSLPVGYHSATNICELLTEHDDLHKKEEGRKREFATANDYVLEYMLAAWEEGREPLEKDALCRLYGLVGPSGVHLQYIV